MDPESPIDLNEVGSPLTCKQIEDKIPIYSIESNWKLRPVRLPYPQTTYWISFGGCRPQPVKMPRSRTFDQMLEFPGTKTIEYELTGKRRFFRAIENQTDRYIINYLDMYPTYWVFKIRRYTVYFTTIGSIFHGDLRIEERDSYGNNEQLIVSTTCDFDTIKAFQVNPHSLRNPWIEYRDPSKEKKPRKFLPVSRRYHRYCLRKMKIKV